MIGLGWKLGIAAVLLVAVGTSVTLAYRHYNGLIQQLAEVREQKAVVETALTVEQATVKSLKGRIAEWDAAYAKLVESQKQLQKKQQWASTEVRRINEEFAKHDLTRLARTESGRVESYVNAYVAYVHSLLECASAPDSGCDASGSGAAPDLDASPTPGTDQPAPAGVSGRAPGTLTSWRLGVHSTDPASVREPREELR